MVEYMFSLTGIEDPQMSDATYGFSIAVFRKNEKLAKIMIDHYLNNEQSRADERERNSKFAKAAILELDEDSPMRSVLEQVLNDLARKFGPVEAVPVSSAPNCRS